MKEVEIDYVPWKVKESHSIIVFNYDKLKISFPMLDNTAIYQVLVMTYHIITGELTNRLIL